GLVASASHCPFPPSALWQSRARDRSSARESGNLTRGSGPSLRNREISRAGPFHRSGIVKSHARERSIARESCNLTRENGPPLGDRKISRAGEGNRSGTEEYYA